MQWFADSPVVEVGGMSCRLDPDAPQDNFGMIQVRRELNDYLRNYAGHIGYSVRPDERQQGIATWMLHNVLTYCREIGLKRVMVACEPWNVGSRKTILRNGGVYEKTVHEDGENIDLEHYWISLT